MTLETCCKLIVDCPHTTAPDEGVGYPLVRTPNIGRGRLIYSGMHRVLKEVYDGRNKRAIPQHGDLIFAREAPAGNVAVIQKDEKVCLGQRTVLLRPDNTIVNSDYLAYYLLSPNVQHRFSALANGATVSHINIPELRRLELSLPPLPIQRRIAAVLGALDDKIELNRKMNANLEAQAQALFKSWFVDFDPWGGVRPSGWKMGVVGDIAEVVGGGTPSKAKSEYFTDNCIAWLTPKDLSITHAKFTERGALDITEEGYKNSGAKLMPKGSVLFSSRAPIGYLTIALNDICTNQGFKSLVPKKLGTAYIYYFLQESTSQIQLMASGSTFKEASGSLMKSLKILIPDEDADSKFSAMLAPVFERQKLLERESRKLAELRDAMLPTLMSGELEVAE